MHKGTKTFIVSSMLALLIAAGCSQAPAQPQGSGQETQQPATGSESSAPEQSTEQPQSDQASQMDEKAAVPFTAKAIASYWHVMAGGKPAEDGAPIQSFPIDGMDYRYLGTDLETKEKLYEYLGAYFTKEAVDSFIEHARIVEHDGKMAQPNADGGSILQWEKAEAVLAKEEGASKSFEFRVPYGEEANIQFEPVTVQMTQGNDGKWLISTPPHNLK